MKKKILLFGMFFCMLNVNASPIYSDYNFIGYTLEPLSESAYYKYEPFNLHKYYSMQETNIVYARLDEEISMSPYIDKNASIKESYYLGSRPRYGNPNPKIMMKLKESYPINTIKFYDFYTYDLDIYEIEVFNKKEKINYEIASDYSFLNDGDIYTGRSLQSDNFTLILDDYYEIKNIKVVVHFYADPYLLDFFTIEYVNESGNNYLALIRLDNYGSDYISETLEFKVGDDYVNFLVENHILLMEDAVTNTLNPIFEYQYPLYKHYNLKKVFHTYSFLDEIEGYVYDEEDDVLVYKVYTKEYLGDDTSVEPIECLEPDEIISLINENEIVGETDNENTDENFVYKVIPVNTKEECACASNITPNTTNNDTKEECICKCDATPGETKSKNPKKIIIIILILICLIITLIELIKLLCDKFTKKF